MTDRLLGGVRDSEHEIRDDAANGQTVELVFDETLQNLTPNAAARRFFDGEPASELMAMLANSRSIREGIDIALGQKNRLPATFAHPTHGRLRGYLRRIGPGMLSFSLSADAGASNSFRRATLARRQAQESQLRRHRAEAGDQSDGAYAHGSILTDAAMAMPGVEAILSRIAAELAATAPALKTELDRAIAMLNEGDGAVDMLLMGEAWRTASLPLEPVHPDTLLRRTLVSQSPGLNLGGRLTEFAPDAMLGNSLVSQRIFHHAVAAIGMPKQGLPEGFVAESRTEGARVYLLIAGNMVAAEAPSAAKRRMRTAALLPLLGRKQAWTVATDHEGDKYVVVTIEGPTSKPGLH